MLSNKKYIFFITPFLWILFLPFSISQTRSNLEIFYQLVDSSAAEAAVNINSDSVEAELILPGNFAVFKNVLLESFSKRDIKIKEIQNTENYPSIIYTSENANVKYSEMFRRSFLGSFYIERKLTYSGNYLIRNNSSENTLIKNSFVKTYIDTVEVEKIEEIENNLYSFTKDRIPSEPLFSSLIEPVIAIGAAAIAVYLFFSVRSK